MTEPRRLTGIAASAGIAAAEVILLTPAKPEVDDTGGHEAAVELERFSDAQQRVRTEIELMKASAAEHHDEWVVKIFDSHLFLIRDPELQDSVTAMIRDSAVSAEYALITVRDTLVSMLENLGDSTMSGRAADLRDLTDRILFVLTGGKQFDFSGLTEPVIIAAVELSPLETAGLDAGLVKGIITEKGGYSCHTAIMARSSGIPAVTGVSGLMSAVEQGTPVIVDGGRGTVIVNPGRREFEEAEEAAGSYNAERRRLEVFIGRESLTTDGKSINIGAHLGSPDELDAVAANGADGIGLFRTEFLFMQNEDYPDEQKQFEGYRKVLEAMAPKPVVIRTMDVGGDKNLPWAGIEAEDNPFLGLRGIRYCLKRPEFFRIQLRALLRAAPYGSLKIMFPMVSTVDEFVSARAILAEEAEALLREGVKPADNMETGAMIEVPSAALCAESLAAHADFFSIGTNDLVQYTMAADRMNEQVSYLYQPLHPAVLQLIKTVCAAAERHGLWTGVCGELAGDLKAVPVLLGLGVTELSVAPPLIPAVRELVTRFSMAELKDAAESALPPR